MTGLIIAIILCGLFIIAIAARLILIETRLEGVLIMLDDIVASVNNLNECMDNAFINETNLANSVDQINEKIKWLDDIDTNKIFEQQQ